MAQPLCGSAQHTAEYRRAQSRHGEGEAAPVARKFRPVARRHAQQADLAQITNLAPDLLAWTLRRL